MKIKLLLATILAIICGTILYFTGSPDTHKELYSQSNIDFTKPYNSFDEYSKIMREEIRNNRMFFTDNKEKEIEANAPQEYKPEKNDDTFNHETGKYTKAVLLVHGLGDSQFSFVDISQSLVEQGFLVRTIVLHGHGTRPGDMLETDYKDWEKLVELHSNLIKEVAENVYLGGFSTGANLAYIQAVQDEEIKGLMLFSPAFKSSEGMLVLTPYLKSLIPWPIAPEKIQYTNYTKYTATPANGYAQYYHTSNRVLDISKTHTFTRPIFAVLSEDDSILDVERISKVIQDTFTNPKNTIMWFGEEKPKNSTHKNLIHLPDEYPELNITNISHMGLLFSPENPYYGKNASEIICFNGDIKPNAYDTCLEYANGNKDIEIWFSAASTQHLERIHARNTYNPYYNLMIEELLKVFE